MPTWSVTRRDPQAGELEAVATSKLFGFQDDVVIRVRPDPPAGAASTCAPSPATARATSGVMPRVSARSRPRWPPTRPPDRGETVLPRAARPARRRGARRPPALRRRRAPRGPHDGAGAAAVGDRAGGRPRLSAGQHRGRRGRRASSSPSIPTATRHTRSCSSATGRPCRVAPPPDCATTRACCRSASTGRTGSGRSTTRNYGRGQPRLTRLRSRAAGASSSTTTSRPSVAGLLSMLNDFQVDPGGRARSTSPRRARSPARRRSSSTTSGPEDEPPRCSTATRRCAPRTIVIQAPGRDMIAARSLHAAHRRRHDRARPARRVALLRTGDRWRRCTACGPRT